MISCKRMLICGMVLSILSSVHCKPWEFDAFEDIGKEKDSEIVQSLIREIRAAPEHVQELVNADTEKAFLHKYSDGDGDAQEYNQRSQDEDAKGYKHFDSYHKEDGDKYGFQHETSYGLENKDDDVASGKSSKYAVVEPGRDEINEEGKLRNQEVSNASEEEEAETKNTYKVVEDAGEHYDGGAGSSGNYDEAADTGYYESEGGDEDEGAHYSEGDDGEGEAGAYNESESYISEDGDGGDGDGESEHYEEEEEGEDY